MGRCTLFLFFWGLVSTVNAQDILLKNAHILHPDTRTVSTGSFVIKAGRISQILDKPPAKFAGRTIDLTGKWVVPAFTDMHIHSTFNNPGPGGVTDRLSIEEVSKRMLSAGVTAFLDLLADEDKIFQARANQKKGNGPLGARIYAAGPMLTCTGGHGTEFGFPDRQMNNPTEARQQVRSLAARHPDIVKIAYDHLLENPAIDQATLAAAIDEAKKLGLKTIVHIGNWADARAATAAGATIVTHLGDTELPDDIVKMMKDRGTLEIPTMTYHTDLLNIVENRSILSAPLLARVTTPELITAYQKMDLKEPYVAHLLAAQSQSRDARMVAVKKLADAGIPLMIGTDSGDVGVFFGFSAHREMAIWVKAGIPTWTALAGSTTLPKQFFGRPSGINVGDRADLAVLSGNPIDDIENTQSVEIVFKDGTLVESPRLITRAR